MEGMPLKLFEELVSDGHAIWPPQLTLLALCTDCGSHPERNRHQTWTTTCVRVCCRFVCCLATLSSIEHLWKASLQGRKLAMPAVVHNVVIDLDEATTRALTYGDERVCHDKAQRCAIAPHAVAWLVNH